ncbi:hypothetical protein E3P96_03011 [Wallemia ichthyophaga]|nr:hypothetical protein E3P96_03011 [Wallemia ichthyophaga]
MSKIRDSFVVIIGLGGVGSWATTMLVRSGVSKVRLVDFDQVTLSSLNRHATAQLKDVGKSKVDGVKQYLSSVAPWCQIEAQNELWNQGVDGDRLLSGSPDYVIDAIDHIPTKVALLKRCKQLNLNVLSCAGAGAKQDPSRVQIADMSNTFEDPLARTIRRKLRSDGVGIPVVYSTEKPGDVKLLPLPEEEFAKGKVQELSAFDDFRVRLLPVLGPLPAMFGLAASTHILLSLAGKEDYAPLPVKNRPKLYEKVFRDFHKKEGKPTVYGSNEPICIDVNQVGYILDEIYNAKSALPPHNTLSRPALVRWDTSKPLSITNLAAMEYKDAQHHYGSLLSQCEGSGLLVWGQEAQDYFTRKSKEVEKDLKALE